MQHAFTGAVRTHLDAAFGLAKPTVSSLHAACYRRARQRFPLPASTIQQARDKALSIYRSVQARRRRKRKASKPEIRRLLPLRLAVENLRVFAGQGVVRITTPEGFLWLPVLAPEAWQHLIRLPHGVSEFVQRGQDWYLMLAVKTEDVPSHDGPHFGLDLGLANLAVLSGPGVVRFFNGKALRYTRGRYFRYRQGLQRKGKIGMVKRSKGRESRWVRCENHRVSRRNRRHRRCPGRRSACREAARHPGPHQEDPEGGPHASRLGLRTASRLHLLQGGTGRRTGHRGGPAAYQPAVQRMRAYGTRRAISLPGGHVPPACPA